METSYKYCSNNGLTVTLYAAPGLEPPETFQMVHNAERVTFYRLSDRSLVCGKVVGVNSDCRNVDCHRRVLGECGCGRHEAPVRFEKAVR